MKRIEKRTAKKLFNGGKQIYAIPCRLNINSWWTTFMPLNNAKDFDKQVNEIEFYNCSYETGRYLHYYINEETIESE